MCDNFHKHVMCVRAAGKLILALHWMTLYPQTYVVSLLLLICVSWSSKLSWPSLSLSFRKFFFFFFPLSFSFVGKTQPDTSRSAVSGTVHIFIFLWPNGGLRLTLCQSIVIVGLIFILRCKTFFFLQCWDSKCHGNTCRGIEKNYIKNDSWNSF